MANMEAKMKKILVILPVLVILSTINAFSQVSQNAVPFLLIAPGARAGGMGETFVAIADDATAVHWNPAGLGRYPLSSNWIEYKSPEDQTIQKIALVKNDLPQTNYKQFDIWAIINGRLAKWQDDRWVTTTTQSLSEGRSLKNIILRYTGLNEEQIEPFYNRLISANNDFPLSRIDSLKQRLTPLIPDDYQYKEEISSGFDRLKISWQDFKLDAREYYEFEKMILKSISDNQMSGSELDSVAFGFDRAVKQRSIDQIEIPYDIILSSPANCLESHAGMLYVGTDNGFYRYDPKRNRWSIYGLEEGLPSLKITALAKYRRKSMIIGTDNGVAYFDGAKIRTYPSENNPPGGYINCVVSDEERNIWAATENNLYYFDGNNWRDYYVHEVTVGEDLDKIIDSFYRAMALIDRESVINEVMLLNETPADLTIGRKLKLPFKPVLRGSVMSLAIKDYALWIGTSNGVILFRDEAFYHFGYREYTTINKATVQEIAGWFLPDPAPEKVEQLSRIIKVYNNLESDTIPAGRTLMIYANALGSPIHAIAAPSSKRAYIGTNFGVVQFNDGAWSRFPKPDLAKSLAHSIKTESGEMWFSTSDKVFILSKPFKQLTFMHSDWLKYFDAGMYFEFFSFIYPTSEWGTFGLGITFLSMGTMQRTGETGEDLGTFSSYDIAFTASYGTRLMQNLAAGLSVRYISSNLAPSIGAGAEKGEGVGFSFALDGGLLYELNRQTTLAATVTNIGPDISYIDADQADPLPRKLAVGFAHNIIDSPYNKLTFVGEANKLLIDLDRAKIEEIIPHVGLEYWYSNYIALRAGYVYDHEGDLKYFTTGASMQWTKYRFDFSYVPSSKDNTMSNTMRFSMNVGF
jgi:hypothetical protein